MLVFLRSVKDVCNARPAMTYGLRAMAVHLPVLGSVRPLETAPADPLVDLQARRIRYLRVSVTDRCNYRCTYCMPEELGKELSFASKSEVLTFEELERVITVFAGL